MTKTRSYEKMPITAPVLAQRVAGFLQEHKYEVSYSFDEVKKTWCLIQARKQGTLRTVTGNRRALNVDIRTKKKNQATVSIGSGQWGKNTIISAAPMIAFPVLGFFNFVNSALSSKMSEADVWMYVESIANKDFYKDQ